MLIVTGSFVAKEGALSEALRLATEHVRRSRLEPGCISHSVHQDAENPSRLFFFEQWSDKAALLTHFAVPESRAFAKAAAEIAVGTSELEVFSAEAVSL
jgi:quinol monooxygenase YgiN